MDREEGMSMASLNRRGFLGMGAATLAGLAAGANPLAMRAAEGKTASHVVPKVKSGGVRMIPVDGGKYKVWTKKIGSGRIKVLTLHGGPGATHEYFECFEDFLPQHGIQDWDRWKDLHEIRVPTLVISGRHDEMNPEDMRREGKLIPNSRVILCESGSHMCLWDDQEAYFRGLLGWIRDVEAGSAGRHKA
jgi:hypothetical protein